MKPAKLIGVHPRRGAALLYSCSSQSWCECDPCMGDVLTCARTQNALPAQDDTYSAAH